MRLLERPWGKNDLVRVEIKGFVAICIAFPQNKEYLGAEISLICSLLNVYCKRHAIFLFAVFRENEKI